MVSKPKAAKAAVPPTTGAPPAALLSAMAADAKAPPSEDTLQKLRTALREVRDQERELADVVARGKELSEQLNKKKFSTLPDMFTEAGIDRIGLEAEGNLPAYDVEMKPYYKASISSEWEQKKQDAAFKWLEDNKFGDLIKNTFTIELGRDDHKTAKKLEAALKKLKLVYSRKRAVNWNTLTAWVKEQIENKNFTPPLETLGATVGKIVNLKPRKDK